MPSVKKRKLAVMGFRAVGTMHQSWYASYVQASLRWPSGLSKAVLWRRTIQHILSTVSSFQFWFTVLPSLTLSTIENTFHKVIKYKGEEFETEVVDTAGQVSTSLLSRLCLLFSLCWFSSSLRIRNYFSVFCHVWLAFVDTVSGVPFCILLPLLGVSDDLPEPDDGAHLTMRQDEYSIFQRQYAVGIHGYVLVYSVTSRSSFNMVKIINDKILNALGNDSVPRVLVGNKTDLIYDRFVFSSPVAVRVLIVFRWLTLVRVVSFEEGKALADSWGCEFFETSAKHNENIGPPLLH